MSWQSARLAAEEKRQELWGTTVANKDGVSVSCEATGPEAINELQRTNVMPTKPVTFTVTNAQFATLNVGLRALLVSNGLTFQIYAIQDDPVDATVDMRCVFKV